MLHSFLSRIVVVVVCSASVAGWAGSRVSPAAELGAAGVAAFGPSLAAPARAAGVEPGAPGEPAVRPGVRDRAAWQPSPVPPAAVAAAPAPPRLPAVPAAAAEPSGREGPGPGAPPSQAAPHAASAVVDAPNQPLTFDRLTAAFAGGFPPERGSWREVTFFSPALGREATYRAWLPPGYDATHTAYPTLYLLHGVGGAASAVPEWIGYALGEDLDRLLGLGEIEPLIVVVPNGEQGYWMNHADGGPRWGDFVAIDLVRHVDATFHTDPSSARRAVGGLSMGGHGALQLSLNHPDVFGVAGAHSPTLRPFETSPAFFGDAAWFERNDPLSLVRSTSAARFVKTWIDVGERDPWRSAIETLRDAYRGHRDPLVFRVLPGEHEGWYWMTYLPEYLRFYSSALTSGAGAT